ncbi:MAG: pseudouridine synthase [Gammaproteobacteria bacterium]|nr:pseudouridine synthase [Gammaproteobacteria bacterium]MCY4274973.1 pseudouridine synthase [Gammaproteobacteria bacterium]
MPIRKNTERLQKYLSRLGVGSRREIDAWIEAGRISVNGKISILGTQVGSDDHIQIDGRPIRNRILRNEKSSRPRVLLYNKPEGEICTRKDPQNRPSVFSKFPRLKSGRWILVGRLDINSRGLLMITNNGDLAQSLMHPSFNNEREYLCRIYGNVTTSKINSLLQGRDLDGRLVKFQRVEKIRGQGRNMWFSVVVTEGRYREIRRLWKSVGCTVSRLNRIRFGEIRLPRDLRIGKWTELNHKSVYRLMQHIKQK